MIEPGQPYVHGWHIDAICDHLQAITDGNIDRLLINIPPGTMKSLAVGVFWPCWEAGPCNMPYLRYVCASHSQNLAIRDNTRARRLIMSDWYQKRWGDRVKLTSDQNAKTKFENLASGFREAAAAGSITGSRGDRVIIDDPHSVESAGSDAMRQTTIDWFLEAVPTRLNNPDSSAIVVVMQRLHEEDVSGVIISKELGYDHLMLPMEFDPSRKCYTSIGFEDPRTEEGELLFPERFPEEVVERDKRVMGSYATAGQFQQQPQPRGGGILKRAYWKLWDDEEAAKVGVKPGNYPPFEFVLASLDTAYTEKQENDPSALTIWGLWKDAGGLSRLMLASAWAERLEFNPLVERVAVSCRRFKVDKLLVEAKASGLSVVQELRRLYGREGWSIQTIDPGKMDKIARAYAIQAIFEADLVYAPERSWSDMVIDQCAVFPKGKNDDLVDSSTGALAYFRTNGLILRSEEAAADYREAITHRSVSKPIYMV